MLCAMYPPLIQVKALLSKAEDVDAIIQAVPELSDPVALSRSLAFLAGSFPSKDPVLLLQENPQILLNLAESNMEDHAEVCEGGWVAVKVLCGRAMRARAGVKLKGEEGGCSISAGLVCSASCDDDSSAVRAAATACRVAGVYDNANRCGCADALSLFPCLQCCCCCWWLALTHQIRTRLQQYGEVG